MSDGAFEAKLDAIQADISRIDTNVARIFQRLDAQAEQAHEVRIAALERSTRGLYGKVTALVSAIVTGVVGVGAWLTHR